MGSNGHPGPVAGRGAGSGRAGVLTIRLLGVVDVRLDGERVRGFDSPRLRSLLTHLLLQRGVPQPRARVAAVLCRSPPSRRPRRTCGSSCTTCDGSCPSRTASSWWTPTSSAGALTPRSAPTSASWSRPSRARTRPSSRPAAAGVGGRRRPLRWGPAARLFRRVAVARARAVPPDPPRGPGTAHGAARGRAGPAAIRYAQQLLRHDPLHEATYRRLMHLHALAGERARALRVYHACSTTLERELGVEPTEETQQVHRSLLRHGETSAATAGHDPPGIPLIGRPARVGNVPRVVPAGRGRAGARPARPR
jgi:hypothetical protein